jgi:hypothetical protein
LCIVALPGASLDGFSRPGFEPRALPDKGPSGVFSLLFEALALRAQPAPSGASKHAPAARLSKSGRQENPQTTAQPIAPYAPPDERGCAKP